MTTRNPAAYGTKVTKPPDFDAFWADIMAQTAAIPLNASVTPAPLRSDDQVEVFEVHYDSLDNVRIAGWYCLPRERSGPLPAMVFYPGYISEPTLPKSHAALGYAAFGAAPRGKLRSNKQVNPGYPGLLAHNIVDRNSYAYKGFYVDACRVIDFLLERPEVDSSRIGIRGSSQGGALTLLVAALRQKVAAASAGAPYLAGVMDAIELTNTYPYREINDYLRLYPESYDAIAECWSYYDCHNFAPQIECPIIVNIGLNDNVCPPETGYAVFDAIGSTDKQLYPYDSHGHDANGFGHNATIEAFFRQHLKPDPLPAPHPQKGREPVISPLLNRIQSGGEGPGERYWSATMTELAQLPAAPELPEIPLRSTDFGTVYGLRLTSLGAYRIFAYYCVPKGEGPFPVLFHAPGYGSVVHVPPYEERQQYIVVALCHRGQRLADQPFAAAYPGLLTTGIEDAQNYVYRGIVADCCRVVDFLLSRPEVDAERIAVIGNDLALFTAALRPQISALCYTPGFFYNAQVSTPQSNAYPSEEINEYVRAYPEAAERVWRTLSYYEPMQMAPRVRAQTLLVTGDDPATTAPMQQALGGAVESYATAHSSYRDGVQQARWLARWSGIGEPVLPEHWR